MGRATTAIVVHRCACLVVLVAADRHGTVASGVLQVGFRAPPKAFDFGMQIAGTFSRNLAKKYPMEWNPECQALSLAAVNQDAKSSRCWTMLDECR